MSSATRGGAALRAVSDVSELSELVAERRAAGARIGLVPTMGAFHEGHISLMRAAMECADFVVVSLFVNPTQFAPGEDLDAYPRDLEGDVALAAEVGVELLWTPAVADLYPDGFATTVSVDESLTGVLCGAHRGAQHFNGVTTVVAKLFNCVGPDVAFFGQKDAQQAIVIKRMARDLDFPVEIEVVPTVRDADGLAMSSRNAYLSVEDRKRATALPKALRAAELAAESGKRSTLDIVEAARAVLRNAGIEPEYVEARDAENLSEVKELSGRPVLVALAARLGGARLIDNVVIN